MHASPCDHLWPRSLHHILPALPPKPLCCLESTGPANLKSRMFNRTVVHRCRPCNERYLLLQVLIFLYVFFSLRRQVHKKDEHRDKMRAQENGEEKRKSCVCNLDLARHAMISTVSFAILTMFEGPPFSLWGSRDEGPARWIPFVSFSFFILMMGMMSDPYRKSTSDHIKAIDAAAEEIEAAAPTGGYAAGASAQDSPV